MALGWRRSRHSGYHYFGDEKYDYGYAYRASDGRGWQATVYARLVKRCLRLKDAKRVVEREVRSRTKNNKRRRRS